MTTTIEWSGERATIDGWEWTSDYTNLADTLNAMLDPNGPSGGDPAPDYHEAVRVANAIGAEIVEFDLPEYVEGRVY